jgi:oxygen-independent coproporphyrinogen III oxidase
MDQTSFSNLEQLAPVDDSIQINNWQEMPTREEFYTNYPFFKYWGSKDNNKLIEVDGINIYIHIPFCIQICDYCFYMKELVKSKSQVDDYVDSLCKEIKMVSEHFGLQNRKVNSIYVGGGTPSVLTEVQYKKIIETLHKYHKIDRPEFTFEAEPGTFTKTKLDWYNETGVNRISMGVQSFVDDIIKLSSRKHSVQQAIQSINMVKDTGDFIVNIDLLSGLAGETTETWEETLDVALGQRIDTLTIYKMKTYANTVFFKKGVHKNEISLPKDDQEVEFFKYALDRVMAAGFRRWTTFAFNASSYRHAYVENTWRGQDLIAYGASSFGKIGNFNYQNLNNIQNYVQKVEENTIPIYRTYELTYKDRIVKELLLCGARLVSYSKNEFINKFGFDYFDLIPATIQQLIEKDYIAENREDLILTHKGILYGDFVGKVIASSVKEALGKDSIGFVY